VRAKERHTRHRPELNGWYDCCPSSDPAKRRSCSNDKDDAERLVLFFTDGFSGGAQHHSLRWSKKHVVTQEEVVHPVYRKWLERPTSCGHVLPSDRNCKHNGEKLSSCRKPVAGLRRRCCIRYW
jgi:hypothetical protein